MISSLGSKTGIYNELDNGGFANVVKTMVANAMTTIILDMLPPA